MTASHTGRIGTEAAGLHPAPQPTHATTTTHSKTMGRPLRLLHALQLLMLLLMLWLA
jgi:hypothetical protein